MGIAQGGISRRARGALDSLVRRLPERGPLRLVVVSHLEKKSKISVAMGARATAITGAQRQYLGEPNAFIVANRTVLVLQQQRMLATIH